MPRDPGSTDPALATDFQRMSATCALLYNYPDRGYPEGARLVPEVADGPPTVSADGRTYEFTVRRGFRFSPPSNEPVTAEAFERTFERAAQPEDRVVRRGSSCATSWGLMSTWRVGRGGSRA